MFSKQTIQKYYNDSINTNIEKKYEKANNMFMRTPKPNLLG
jgi:hypothetical protein